MTILQDVPPDLTRPRQPASTIAQFVFTHDPALNLPLLVKELDRALQRSGAGLRKIAWDGDDLALLDVEGARFTLSYSTDAATGPASLMISVGPGTGGPSDPVDRRRHDELCHLIANRLQLRFAPERMLWHQVTGPVTADLIDDLFDRLPDFDMAEQPPASQVRSETAKVLRAFPETKDIGAVSFAEKARALKAAKIERAQAAARVAAQDATQAAAQAAAPSKTAPVMTPANSQPAPNPEMARLRAALYPAASPAQPAQTVRLRLAASTMDMTLMIVCLPAGAAMLTYSVLRGGNVNASGRMMALTCSLLGLSQLPLAQGLTGLV